MHERLIFMYEMPKIAFKTLKTTLHTMIKNHQSMLNRLHK